MTPRTQWNVAYYNPTPPAPPDKFDGPEYNQKAKHHAQVYAMCLVEPLPSSAMRKELGVSRVYMDHILADLMHHGLVGYDWVIPEGRKAMKLWKGMEVRDANA